MNRPAPIDLSQARRPTLARRLASILYDSIVVGGLMLFAAALVVIPLGLGIGQQEWEHLQQTWQMHLALRALLLAVMIGFHLGFWTHGGQSLGMRAWRLRVVRWDGEPLRLRDALIRYAAAWLSALVFGLGFLWSLWDRDRYTWHDRLSQTRLVMLRYDR